MTRPFLHIIGLRQPVQVAAPATIKAYGISLWVGEGIAAAQPDEFDLPDFFSDATGHHFDNENASPWMDQGIPKHQSGVLRASDSECSIRGSGIPAQQRPKPTLTPSLKTGKSRHGLPR